MEEMMPNLEVNQQHWITYFHQHPELQEFFNTYHISKETVLTAFNQLYQYIEEKKNCEQCTGIEQCPNLLKGHYTVLTYQHEQFQTSLKKCGKLTKKEEEEYHKRLFKSLYVPTDILNASFLKLEKTFERKEALKALITFCNHYQHGKKEKGIYLYGPLGVGKSHMMAAAANKLAEKGISTLMVYVPDFFREMKSSIQDQSINEKIDVLKTVEVLILDDIGAETISQWERDEILGAILQARMVTGLPTLYTSNFHYDDLEKHLSYSNKGGEEVLKAKRLMERIRHYTTAYFVDGPNRRISD